MQTLELGYVNAGFIAFGALLLLTLLLGRFFCGWACHVVAYQDASAWLLGKLGVRPRPVRARVLKLVPFAAAFYMFAWPTLERWWQGRAAPEWTAHLTTDAFWRTFPGPWMAALTLLVDGGLIVWWLGAKGFCTYGCPYGALFGLADRVAVARIRVTDACEGCGHCTAVCTSNVRVHQEVATFGMVVDSGCMKCLDCVNSCPKEALYFGVGKPAPLFAGFQSAALTRASNARADGARAGGSDLTWSEEILAALTFLVGLYAFRDLYAKVPFLLAIGMSAIAAIALIAAKRAVKDADFQLQWSRWRIAGRFTRAGLVGSILVVAALAFLLHSAAVQYHARAGERSLQRFLDDPRDAAAAQGAESHLASALSLGLFPDGRSENLLAVLYQRTGRPEEALPHLRRALDVERTSTRLAALAAILGKLGRPEEARDALRQSRELDPPAVR